MKGKNSADYLRLKTTGLTRIHSGMESGSLKVLKLIRKGFKPEDILKGGIRVVGMRIVEGSSFLEGTPSHLEVIQGGKVGIGQHRTEQA